jgi:predicted transcriptional regulator
MTNEEARHAQKKGHMEEQIITALKQYEGCEKTAEICWKLGISQAIFYVGCTGSPARKT